ncbi:MAG: VOC family protein [Nannocystales bacterium]
MSDPFLSRVGAVLSADIAVPQHARVLAFYASVLGTGDGPLWGDKLLNNLGMPVVGVGERLPEYEHLPLQWMPHIQVADVAVSVERALSLGGSELMHNKGEDGASQWAVLLDPNEAAFGLVPAGPAGPSQSGEHDEDAKSSAGRIAWLDLTVADAATTGDFYRQVTGWSVEDVAMKPPPGDKAYADYCMLDEDNSAVAGVCHARGVNVGLPPVWLLYLPVGDLAESIRLAGALGGEVVKATRGSDGEYASAVIRDPVGAHLALVQG